MLLETSTIETKLLLLGCCLYFVYIFEYMLVVEFILSEKGKTVTVTEEIMYVFKVKVYIKVSPKLQKYIFSLNPSGVQIYSAVLRHLYFT